MEQRRARRTLWAIRLIFYPALIAGASIDVRMRCPSGIWAITWTTRHAPHVTETTTHHYRFHDQTGRRTIVLDARLADGSVEGTSSSPATGLTTARPAR